ncbi:MAG: hypothetical protein ACK5MV_08650 [Aminipila sp.]
MAFFILVWSFTALFVGCSNNTNQDEPSASKATTIGQISQDEAILYERYLDVVVLPTLNIALDEVYTFEDRNLDLKCPIDNELEYIVYQQYYYDVSADFEKYKALFGDSDSMRITSENQEK